MISIFQTYALTAPLPVFPYQKPRSRSLPTAEAAGLTPRGARGDISHIGEMGGGDDSEVRLWQLTCF